MATHVTSATSSPPRHALVTGAARGIGAEIARTLAADGMRVTLLGRDAASLEQLAATLPGEHYCAVADIADGVAVTSAFSSTRDALGPISILVNTRAASVTGQSIWVSGGEVK